MEIKANVEELRLFAQNLNSMGGLLNENYNIIKTQAHNVSETWEDKENIIFMEELFPQTDVLYSISEMMHEYARFINKKADALQNYLDTKM